MESKLPAPDWSGKQINLEEGKHMTAYVITFVIMVGVFMAGCFALKLPVMWVYFLLCTDEFVKWPWVLGHYRKGTWLKNITREGLFTEEKG